MIDSATAFVIVGATLQAVPVGHAVVTFFTRRSRAADVGSAAPILPTSHRNLRSSS